MAQAMLDLKNKTNERIVYKDSQTQTETVGQIYNLGHNKLVKLYYSTVYKENVLAFCLSSSKSFIVNKTSWKLFKRIIPVVEDFFQ